MGAVDAGSVEGSDARLLELSWRANPGLGRGNWAYHRRSAPLGRPQCCGEDLGNAGSGGPVILESTSSQEAYGSMRNEPRMTFQNSTRKLRPGRILNLEVARPLIAHANNGKRPFICVRSA